MKIGAVVLLFILLLLLFGCLRFVSAFDESTTIESLIRCLLLLPFLVEIVCAPCFVMQLSILIVLEVFQSTS